MLAGRCFDHRQVCSTTQAGRVTDSQQPRPRVADDWVPARAVEGRGGTVVGGPISSGPFWPKQQHALISMLACRVIEPPLHSPFAAPLRPSRKRRESAREKSAGTINHRPETETARLGWHKREREGEVICRRLPFPLASLLRTGPLGCILFLLHRCSLLPLKLSGTLD